MRPADSAPCPCRSGQVHAEFYGECCGPLHAGVRAAGTAEALMRSRYSAFVVPDVEHLLRTWHSGTRPARLTPDPERQWTGLDVLAVIAGGLLHPEGTVEFRAHYRRERRSGSQHEVSRFVREGGRWVYLDALT